MLVTNFFYQSEVDNRSGVNKKREMHFSFILNVGNVLTKERVIALLSLVIPFMIER